MILFKRIGSLTLILLFSFYKTCFADVVMHPGESHGRYINREGVLYQLVAVFELTLIGIWILVAVICIVKIIKRIIKKKKENSKDNS